MHPGAMLSTGQLLFDPYPAESVLHWFRVDRPGQSRGLPDIMPALPLFAQLRRFTLAVIGAAEIAADQALVMKTNAPAGEAAAEVPNGAVMDFERNMAVFAPEGWEPYQIKAEQPATTYAMFKREILGEIARCLNLPYNIAACDSSSYNFASGQLDHQTYYRSLRVDQTHCEAVVLDRILDAWMAEAVTVYPELNGVEELPHQWFWDGRDVGNPIDLANAASTRLQANTTTLSAEYAKQGKDWETELRQRAKEVALAKELGLTLAQTLPAAQSQPEEAPSAKQGEPNATKQKTAA
jgi:capsid protein